MEKHYYSDGACSGNPGPGGWGLVSVLYAHTPGNQTYPMVVEVYQGADENTTNNRMEMIAVLECMKLAAADPVNQYICHSDSAYVVNMCNDWIYKWAQNGWQNSKKQTVENLDLVKEIYKYLTIDFFNFQLVKCQGHCGILENELADALATNNSKKWKELKERTHFVDYSNNF